MSLEVELLELAARGDEDELETRIRGLSLNDFVHVMKSLQRLDAALCDYSDQWENAPYWGRGVEFPIAA
jgi:hypothetical protein